MSEKKTNFNAQKSEVYEKVYEKVYGNVNGSIYGNIRMKKIKKLYSEPKIYTGGVDVSQWSTLPEDQKQKAIKKTWYVYFSFRHPVEGVLKRQNPIKAGNEFKDKKNRLKVLEGVRKSLLEALENGFNPYQNETDIDRVSEKENKHGAKEAIEVVLDIKKSELSSTTYSRFEPRIKSFIAYLEKKGLAYKDIKEINKKIVTTYLDSVLKSTSAANRNNERADLSSVFTKLKQRDFIDDNFIKSDIEILKTSPSRNKTFSKKLLNDIEKELSKNEPHLLLFIRFVSFNFLRPIEVCRLKVKDINLEERMLSVRTKNKPLKTKIIPDILFEQLPDLKFYRSEDYLFTPSKTPGPWEAKEDSKREFFSNQFKKIKEIFDLGNDYGIYSFRHTYITHLYRSRRKEGHTPNEVKSWLMMITGHATISALDKYLREIDAELPAEYSQYLRDKPSKH